MIHLNSKILNLQLPEDYTTAITGNVEKGEEEEGIPISTKLYHGNIIIAIKKWASD